MSVMDTTDIILEKNQIPNPGAPITSLHSHDGYQLDPERIGNAPMLKTTANGRTVLVPQPTDSPDDPLNWPSFKKNILLGIICVASFLADYGSATGIATLVPQATYWHISPITVTHSLSGNVFMLGAGGIAVVSLSAYFGRLPVLFWFILAGVLTAIWTTVAVTFDSFFAARIVNGFFITVAQSGGLMWIQDMFFLHEQARKINTWSLALVISPYAGPLLGSFIVQRLSWRWPFGIWTIAIGLCLIAIIIFADETYYNRSLPAEKRLVPQSRWMRLIGVEQWRFRSQPISFLAALYRPFQALKWPVFLIFFYQLVVFAPVVGINTSITVFLSELYDFSPRAIGFFYFAPIIAGLIGWVAGHYLHDFVAKISRQRNAGVLEPEARLLVIWIVLPFEITGLVLVGYALQYKYHFLIVAFAWGVYIFSLIIATGGLNTYLLHAYPGASGEVAAWSNFGRLTGGFIASYFEVTWALADGPKVSFGIQAAISVVFLGIIGFLQYYGQAIRKWERVDGRFDAVFRL